MQLFSTPPSHPVIIILIVIYAIAAAITTYDIRYIQAKRRGELTDRHLEPPFWIGFFGYILWLTWIGVLLLNWILALVLVVGKFILKVLPVLEIMGEEIMRPFSKPIQSSKHVETMAYERLVNTLDQIKEGNAPDNQKIIISRKLIEDSPITDQEKSDLHDMVYEVYNKENKG